jgi:hypothetical protein
MPEPLFDAGTLPDGGPCLRELVLGTETDVREFRALVDGADLRIIAGPQGGWHVWVSVQASALPRSGVLTYVLRSGNAVVAGPLRIDLQNAPIDSITCGWERRSDALTFQSSGEPFRGLGGQLEVTWESFGSTPITLKRSVVLQ